MKIEPVFRWRVQGGFFLVYQQPPPFSFYEVRQTHSDIVSTTPCGEEADGMILPLNEEKPLCIKTADCLPIYLLGSKQVALIHAGWRGLHNGILSSPLLKTMAPSYAFIGPAICQNHYEVGSEFLNYFGAQHIKQNQEKYFFDLVGQATSQLKEAYPHIEVETSKLCTYENSLLHSFRLNKTAQRNYNIFTHHQEGTL